VQIVIAESQAATLRALVFLLDSMTDLEIIGTAQNQHELLGLAKTRKPDMVILDENLVGSELRELVSMLKEIDSRMAVIVLLSELKMKSTGLGVSADAIVMKNAPPKELLLTVELFRTRQGIAGGV